MQRHASLVRSVAPAVRPLTLAEAKNALNIHETDGERDVYVEHLIDTAVSFVDGKNALGRAMITQTWQQWVGMSPGEVPVLMTPFQSLTGVHYYDDAGVLQQATLSNFEAVGTPDETVVRPKDGFAWPTTQRRPDAIRLTYTAGYGDAASDVPPEVRQAMLMMIAHWHLQRETASEVDLTEVPYGARDLLGLQRASWYG